VLSFAVPTIVILSLVWALFLFLNSHPYTSTHNPADMLQLPQMTTTLICSTFGDNFADTFLAISKKNLSRSHTCTFVVGVFWLLHYSDEKNMKKYTHTFSDLVS